MRRISPVLTERSVTKLDDKRAIKRREHWQKIAQSACEQCGRNIVPIIDEVLSLNDWHDINPSAIDEAQSVNDLPDCNRRAIDEAPSLNDWNTEQRQGDSTRLILHPEASATLSSVTPPASDVTLLIGSEGGFSNVEYERAAATGFDAISLGPRVLRTETAAIATIATVQAFWGDMQS